MGFRRRLLLLYLLTCAGALVVWGRVGQLQLIDGEDWARAARRARELTVELEPRRGAIVDDAGVHLVEDVPVLQLALVLSEWNERSRLRCEACGALLFRAADARRLPRCRCRAAQDRLLPEGEGDLGPLEDLLEVPRGALAARARERQKQVDELVEAEARRLEVLDGDDFLTEERLATYRRRREELPIPIATGISDAAARLVALDEDGVTRGLLLRPAHQRVERASGPLARVLGESSLLSRERLARLKARFPDDGIGLRTPVGGSGLEGYYDDLLRGRPGSERRARDDQGTFGTVVESDPPRPGARVRLGVSQEANALAQRHLEALPDQAANYAPRTRPSGALVLMDASNGQILALAELPAWDPDEAREDPSLGGEVWPLADRLLGDWVPARRVPGPALERPACARLADRLLGFERLALAWRAHTPALEPWPQPPEGFQPDRWRKSLCLPTGPLLSRVSQVAVEPGSAFKVFIGLAMLESGLPLPVQEVFACRGTHASPGCHPHLDVDFEMALCVSCNQYFAWSLRNFRGHWATYRRSVADLIDRLGFGHTTGGDLQGEARGRWLRAAEWGADETPLIRADDAQNVAIGQGEILTTPLQMVRAVAALANGGRLVTPHLAVKVEHPDGRVSEPEFPVVDLGVSPESLARVREGMRRVVYDPHGTAYRSFPWGTIPGRVFGKTGTSQVGRAWKPFDPDQPLDVTHQWFVGFVERDGRSPLAFAVVHHARLEKAAGLTAARTAGAFLSAWCAR